MRINRNHTIEELKAIYKDASPKFVALKNTNGEYVLHYNRPKLTEPRWAEIFEVLKRKTTPPGVYLVGFKNSVQPNAQETEYPIQIGSAVPALNEPQLSFSQPMESVWTTSQALDIISQKNRLELELAFEKERNRLLESTIKELEDELNQAETLSENSGSPLSWVKDLKDTFGPLAEIYFDQRERQLNIDEKKIGLSSPGLRNVRNERTDGGVMPGTGSLYKQYFENILNSGNDDALNQELDYLERFDAELYRQTMKFYNITDEPGEPEQAATG